MLEKLLNDSFKNETLEIVQKVKREKEPTLLTIDEYSETPKILELPSEEQTLMPSLSNPRASLIAENEASLDKSSDETEKGKKVLKVSLRRISLKEIQIAGGMKSIPHNISDDTSFGTPKILEPLSEEQTLTSSPNSTTTSVMKKRKTYVKKPMKIGKLKKFHREQDVNPIPLDITAHNSSESPKILEPHCGMKNLKKCCCQTTDGSCSSMKYFINLGRKMDTMMRNHVRAEIQVERMMRRLELIEKMHDKKYSKKKGRIN